MKKKLTISCIILISLFLVNCQKKTEKLEPITICVESQFADDTKRLLDLWKSINQEVNGKLEILPTDEDSRDIRITAIRTELMAGEGPDIFILSTDNPGYTNLFENPEKAMYSDMFLPLDSFLEQADHINTENWNSKIWKAGKTEEGQMILPLTYFYEKYAFPKSILGSTETIPSSWEELIECGNSSIQGAMFLYTYRFYPLFGEIANYKEEELLFTQKELFKWAEEASAYITANEEQDIDVSNVICTNGDEDNFYTSLSNSQEEMIISGFPNVDGGTTALIQTYVAVNRNTKMKEEAFSFLDLLFRDEILCSQSINYKEEVLDCNLPSILSKPSIHNDDLPIRYPKLSEADLLSLKKTDEQITAVRFRSDIEKELEDMFWPYFQSYYHGENKKIREEILSKTYETIQMKLLE